LTFDSKKPVTLKDVSKAAGLSYITVSRTLRHPETVRANTREKVQKTIEELGYVPNLAARSLLSKRSDMIGVVVPILASSLFSDFVQGVTKTLDKQGLRMLLAVSNWCPRAEEEAVRTFIASQADAIILTGFSHTQATRKMLEQYGRPVVESWNLSDTVIDSAVGFDNYAAAAEMTRYLIERGYRNILLVGGASKNNDQSADRRRGFVDTLQAAGRTVHPETIIEFENPATIESGGPLISGILSRKNPPDAVFFLAELPAQGALLWCLSNGVRVPEDIAIAGFGDLSHSALLPVPLSTVKIRGHAIGERTADIICKGLQGENVGHLVDDIGYSIQKRKSA